MDIDHPSIPKVEPRYRRYRPVATDFNLEPHFLAFLVNNAFFAEISRNIKKVYTLDVPTAGVLFDKNEDMFMLYINPEYVKTLTGKQIQGLLHHEFYHIIFGHCAMKQLPHKLWNVAQDMAINSIIRKHVVADPTTIDMGTSWIIPGERATIPVERITKKDGTLFTDEEINTEFPLIPFTQSMPVGMSSAQYFHALVAAGFDKIIKDDEDGFYGFEMDDHDRDGVGEVGDDYIMAKAFALTEKAVKSADANGSWGNVPMSMRVALRAYINRSVDWKAILRQFIGYLNRGDTKSSIKKINRRYPYIHPGKQRATVARLLIAIDESGSVDNEMLELFYASIQDLSAKVEIDVIKFDYTVNEESLETWKKGAKPPATRTRGGGTDFDAPTQYVNRDENRGRWDGLLIVTDGGAPAPSQCKIRRGWVYPDSCKLNFGTDETQIIVTANDGNLSEAA
jgi:predicted metal-dependent peptidase